MDRTQGEAAGRYLVGVARSKKKLSERSPRERLLIVLGCIVSLGLVAGAERDIQRRPADAMRGSKLLWRVVSLNALGAVGYLVWGRRSRPA